jgi:hypothetical protein
LRAALKAMNADIRCFSDIQPEVGTVLKAGDFEPIIVATSASTLPAPPSGVPDMCTAVVGLTLMNHAIEVHAAYQSAYEQGFETKQVIAVDKGALLDRLN